MLPLFNGRKVASDGRLSVLLRTSAIPASVQRQGGWAMDADGRPYVDIGPVGSDRVFNQGIAFTPDGAMYVTEDAPTSTSIKIDGVAVSASGAVHYTVVKSPPSGGIGLSSNGSLSLGNEIASFSLDLQSSAVPEYSIGSGPPTFTRATTKYVIDWEGVYRQLASGEIGFTGARRVRNLVTKSEDFEDASYTLLNGTLTTGVVDPFGTNRATTLTATATNGLLYTTPAFASTSGVNSVYLRRRTGTGTVSILNPGSGRVAVTLTSSWQRFSASGAPDGNLNYYPGVEIATSGDAVDVAFLMAESTVGQSNQNPSEYVSVGVLSAPYHGCGIDGVKCFKTLNGNTVTDNVVTEATGAAITNANSDYADASGPFGYNAEGARTNSALHSRKLAAGVTATAWTESNITAADDATGVDGVANACSTLTATANNGTILQAITLASAAAIFQPFVKRKTGTGTIEITLNGGTNWTDITAAVDAAAPDWYSLAAVTATLANPSIGYRLGTSGDAIIVDMNDCQNGAERTSPIPTTTAAVARNSDLLTYAAAGNFSGAAGSAYAELMLVSASVSTNPGAVTVTGGNLLYVQTASGKFGVFDGATQVVFGDAPTYPIAAPIKVATAWGGSSMGGSAAGSAVTTGAFDGSLGGTTISVGNNSGGNGWVGNIRFLKIYPQALSSAQLEALTA